MKNKLLLILEILIIIATSVWCYFSTGDILGKGLIGFAFICLIEEIKHLQDN